MAVKQAIGGLKGFGAIPPFVAETEVAEIEVGAPPPSVEEIEVTPPEHVVESDGPQHGDPVHVVTDRIRYWEPEQLIFIEVGVPTPCLYNNWIAAQVQGGILRLVEV